MMPREIQYLYLYYLCGPEAIHRWFAKAKPIDLWAAIFIAEKLMEEFENDTD